VSPGNWEYPTYGWKSGDAIKDNHGLVISRQSDSPLTWRYLCTIPGMGHP